MNAQQGHPPTPAEMLILLSWLLITRGYVLACETGDVALGVGRGWWAIPASTWWPTYRPEAQP